MKRKRAAREYRWVLVLAVLGSITLAACDVLNTQPLDEPSNEAFFSNHDELLLAVNAAYRELQFGGFFKLDWALDMMTDIAWVRGAWSGVQATGRGDHGAQTDLFEMAWENYYEGIAKTNNLLENMDRAKDVVSPDFYNRIQAEARFLRAYYYHRLTALYGGVPLITEVQSLDSTDVPRTPKQEVVDFILKELEAAASALPVQYPPEEEGRATKGAALAIKARVALYNEQWDVAIDAARRIMDLGVYSLYPDYRELFTYAGEENDEAILTYPYLDGDREHNLPQHGFSRMTGGWSTPVPLQSLVDRYWCVDGKPIDESSLYDPAHPFENRDPRLQATIVVPGSRFGDYRFLTHPDSVMTWDYVDQTWVENGDVTNPYATFSGYIFRKHMDPSVDASQLNDSELNWILVRYAEVLLTYAEAKIEAGQIDGSVYAAINRIRRRVDMPPVEPGKSHEALRRIVRHERTVELAFEGLRLFDIRRWRIAEEVMNGPAVGRPKGGYATQGIPTFGEHGLPDYSAYLGKMRVIEQRHFTAPRDYLWPIPQSEMDANSKLKQNPGY